MAICISPRHITLKIFGSAGLRNAQRNVGAGFLLQAVPDVARGHELALVPASGPSLTANCIGIVGGSIGM